MTAAGDAPDAKDASATVAPSQVPPVPTWSKARLPRLGRSTTAESALASIVHSCVEHLRGNAACVLARAHEEGVHQMRVAVRRLRSCLALFAPFLPAEQHDHLTGELKWLIGELGPARDWDVFVGEILKPVLKQLEDGEVRLAELSVHVERQRDAAYARAQVAVGAQRYRGLVLLLSSWADGRGWRDARVEGQGTVLSGSATHIAHQLLHDIYQGLLIAGAGFESLEPEERHKVRIQLKKLRYASEFFSSLYPKRKVTPYLAAMKALQDDLGTNNDVEVAKKLLKRALKGTGGRERARLSYAAGMVVGWHGHVSDDREQLVIAGWTRLTGRQPYWQMPGEDLPGESATADEKDGAGGASATDVSSGDDAAGGDAPGQIAAEPSPESPFERPSAGA